ncbi:MAG TPA: hypothetical protein ENK05_08755 [Gammaproteobacteria bacterium]|nr:hypothetical protein [Gammaproteobacteria bacterium]
MIYASVNTYNADILNENYHPRMTRRDALIDLINKKFGGSQAEFARAINRAPAQVHHWVSGHRNIGDAGARHIELSLGLPQGYLDNPDKYQEIIEESSQIPSIDIDCLTQALEGLDILETEFGKLKNPKERAEFLWELYKINKELTDSGAPPMDSDKIIRLFEHGRRFASR